jgi:chemotaxis protein methyltransferase CheR
VSLNRRLSRAAAKERLNQARDSGVLLEELQADEAGFHRISIRIKKYAGIHLPASPKNLSLVSGRLHSVIRGLGLKSYLEYDKYLESSSGVELQEFISALTTNTTQFFREESHFQVFAQNFSKCLEDKRRRGDSEVRVWCAASSTGQEPYSLLMTMKQILPAYPGIQLRFLASDIDTEVLQTASDGVYSAEDLKTLPALHRQRWVNEREDRDFEIRSELRSAIRFARFNLQTEKWPFQFPFDFIFCRNVLIYFDREDCMKIIDKMTRSLAVGGHLFLGHSESGMLRHSLLESVGNAVARRKKSG